MQMPSLNQDDEVLGRVAAAQDQPARSPFPPRPAEAPTGPEFMRRIYGKNEPRDGEWAEREKRIFEQLERGNVPRFLRQWRLIRVSFKERTGAFWVLPDYLAI